MSNEHTRINSAMRDAFRASRITVDNSGRVLRGPAAEEIEELTEEVPSKRPGSADGGARGATPVDPNAVINNAIRESAGRRGS
jgi:hypothetical protein